MKVKTVLLLFIVVFISKTKAQSELQQLSWMLGTWKYETPNYTVFETWKVKNDTILSGYSHTIKGADTLSSEQIEIVKSNHKIVYYATVQEQNGGAKIPFVMYEYTNKSIAFENLLYDFPQRIIYKRKSINEICATIEGKIEGKLKSRDFIYIK